MGVRRVVKALHAILASSLFMFNVMAVHSEATGSSHYIEIDHELEPRKIENINDMSPLPVPPGRDEAVKKYPVSKRQIQSIILETEEQKESNDVKFFKPFKARENGSWKNESDIRKSKLRSVIGTDGEVYYDADWGLMSAVLTCYNNHWALRTGPEDWWTVAMRRIVQAMDKYGEEPQVRDFFVEHKGKKKLEIIVGATLSDINYNWLFSQFSSKIKENLKISDYVDIIENDFSSSTDEQLIISQIMLMSSMKNYFEYGFGTLCGIPGVEMKGTEQDWEKLIDKINRLESLLSPINKYLRLTPWFKIARKVFMNLLDTYRGKPNIEWWGNILSWNEVWGSGLRPHWSGWFPEFFGAGDNPGEFIHFPSDLVTVPIHISDFNNAPPVEDDGIVVAGIVGFNLEEGGRAPVVEPKHAWSLLLPEDSQVAGRLTGGHTGAATTRHQVGTPIRQPTAAISRASIVTPTETHIRAKKRNLANKMPHNTNNTTFNICQYYCRGRDKFFCCDTSEQRALYPNTNIVIRDDNMPKDICKYWCSGEQDAHASMPTTKTTATRIATKGLSGCQCYV
ncbi:unnamed protein product [Meganyctiphanes norvegica]|uniref:Uncharacterized protein n=1 Tax=Meganyctiphanes norvegica TaxID=48144 RepID=A0AAV2R6T4_MEGNR